MWSINIVTIAMIFNTKLVIKKLYSIIENFTIKNTNFEEFNYIKNIYKTSDTCYNVNIN